jgi:hypothetical protein
MHVTQHLRLPTTVRGDLGCATSRSAAQANVRANNKLEKEVGRSEPIQYTSNAGWSSLVARWAHNPKVAGSNPAPATKWEQRPKAKSSLFYCSYGFEPAQLPFLLNGSNAVLVLRFENS